MDRKYFEEKLKTYITVLNSYDTGTEELLIDNEKAYDFLKENVPLFDCPDKNLELTYYFRWWAFRKHIKTSPEGYLITEFLPDVCWSLDYNTINMASGFHILEGRWIRNRKITGDYINFWLNHPYNSSQYTSWMFDSMYKFAVATENFSILENSLDKMIDCFQVWEDGYVFRDEYIGKKEKGLYRNIDDRDGSEISIGGTGYRPLFNCCVYSHAKAISKVAERCKNQAVQEKYGTIAEHIKNTYISTAWNKDLNFFTVIKDDGTLCDVRELHGYAPWYFDMIDSSYDIAWKYINDKNVFRAPYGLTFCQQDHAGFKLDDTGHECKWNGPSWPLTTSFTLDAMSRMLHKRDCDYVDKTDFYDLLTVYSNSQRIIDDQGRIIPWIDEDLNPYTGDWIARTVIKKRPDDPFYQGERGREYNHSSFCDLVIGGLVGVSPNENGRVDILPLITASKWDWFAMINIPVKDKLIDVVWDKYGNRYHDGKGFKVICDGKVLQTSDGLEDFRNLII